MAEDISPVASRPRRGARVPPHDLQAEQSLLGAMMLEAEAIATAAGVLRAEDFYKPAHAHIFDAIHALYAAGQPVDPVTVADELRRNGLLETVGGHQVLVDIMASTPATTNAAGYARIVEEHALLRRLIGVAGEIAEIGYGLPEDVTKALDRAEALVYEVNQRRVTDSTAKIEDLLGLSLDRLEQLYGRGDAITGVPTGYVDLDELLSGLQPSNLVVVGARPAMGKCVAWDTPVVDPSTGELRTAAEVHRVGTAGADVAVLTLTPEGDVRRARPSAFVDDGRKRVHRVRTRSGREVRTTASHPFLTPTGWRPLADLAPGQLVGVPAVVPVFGDTPLPDDEVVMLAHLVMAPGAGDDGPRLWTDNREVAADLELRGAGYGVAVTARTPPGGGRTWDVTGGPALRDLARAHGIAASPTERRVPRAVFRLPREQLARFLNRALGAGGSVWGASGDRPGRLVAGTRSSGLAHDLQHLLLRFGIAASIERSIVAVDQATWTVHDVVVEGRAALATLAAEIGALGHEAALGAAVAQARTLPAPAEMAACAAGGGRPRARGASSTVEPPGDGVLWDEIVAIEDEGDEQVYDLTVPGTHNFVAADVFVHNTSFALGMASHAALHAGKPVLLFSLEMGSLELSQRLLSAEARIDSKRVRTGQLSEDDWSRISQAIGRLASAPIWIDDNPNLTVMEVRAKARRLRSQVGDLGMVVVDYLQLMTGRGSAENRQVEVAEMSRGLKILARELECPVVALSQLSRQLELRADKRPMLADLRESGCLTADARVLRADTGAEVTIGELAASGERDIPVWSLDTDLHMVPATMTHAFPTGVKAVFELRLASGRRVTASANHPFLTATGWLRLDELTIGHHIAVPRVVPAPKEAHVWSEAEVVMLAHMLGDGCAAPRQPVHYTSADPDCLDAVEAAAAHFGTAPRRVAQGTWTRLYLPSPVTPDRVRRNPVAEWLDRWGLYGTDPRDHRIPAPVFALADAQVAAFLGHLWSTEGCGGRSSADRIVFEVAGHRMADDLRLLLLRLGIGATVREVPVEGEQPRHEVAVEAGDDLATLLHRVPPVGQRRVLAAALQSTLEAGASGRVEAGERAAVAAPAPPAPTGDAGWDRVVAIEPRGRAPVFDATVESTHNFVANGITVENSIEQDADVVMFIYRDDVYHPDSPDRGQAEIIVAKHRNGPTGVCRLAFLEQFTRFANMAKVD